MGSVSKPALFFTLLTFIPFIAATCLSQSPFFPPPTYSQQSSEVWEAFSEIEASLSDLVRNNTELNTSSYSIEVTSSHSTLWSTFHTAKDKNSTRPGAENINENSRYRIASITKVFTVLGILQQHAAGNLSLDDAVDKYITNLRPSWRSGSIPWGDITIRSLASQLSGLPRDWAQGDLLNEFVDPTVIGLPPVPPSSPELSDLPKCDSYNHHKPCTAQELLDTLRGRPALFLPNQKSTYSNIAFEILGLVLSNVTGLPYEEYITSSILHPLNMRQTSFSKPPDSVAVLPKNNGWYWDVDEGVQNPTGGLYCSSSDMSIFLRHILSQHANIANTKINWLLPVSFTPGLNSFYGMPWEIYRTEKIVDGSSGRTVSFFTKGGGLPGYRTLILLVPEYDLGITIFTAGDEAFLDVLLERITPALIRAADTLAARQVKDTYVGTFVAQSKINSSLSLTYTSTHGLEITNWISNGTDVLSIIPVRFHFPKSQKFHAQLIPTSLHRDEESKKGELWRIAVTMDREAPPASSIEDVASAMMTQHAGSVLRSVAPAVWDDFCITDVDTMMYAGKPLNEIVFWDKDEKSGRYGKVELTAFRINMTRADETKGHDTETDGEKLIVQEL